LIGGLQGVRNHVDPAITRDLLGAGAVIDPGPLMTEPPSGHYVGGHATRAVVWSRPLVSWKAYIGRGLPARFLCNRIHGHMDTSPEFFSWLANQSAFVEVVIGVFFCLVVAPAILAGIATAVTRLEGFVETGLSAIPMLKLTPAFTRSSGTSRWPSGVAELVSRITGVAVKRLLQKL